MKRVQQAAQGVLTRSNRDLPIDVESIAQELNIVVRLQALDSTVSGVLVIKGDSAVVGVNADHHPHRRRFTIAHELGHYVLHGAVSRVFIDGSPMFYRDQHSADGSELEEIEANAFAAELLMPEGLVRDAVGGQLLDAFDDATVRRLATQFAVSVQAMTIRLTKLGLLTL